VRLTQQQLAQHLGTRREVVARLLLEFADAGFLETRRGSVTLLNTNRLRDIATAS
jgi:CRP/FNR family transcriptional regulator